MDKNYKVSIILEEERNGNILLEEVFRFSGKEDAIITCEELVDILQEKAEDSESEHAPTINW